MEYELNLKFTLKTDDVDAPKKLSQDFIDTLVRMLNESHESNDCFFDDMQGNIESCVLSYHFSGGCEHNETKEIGGIPYCIDCNEQTD